MRMVNAYVDEVAVGLSAMTAGSRAGAAMESDLALNAWAEKAKAVGERGGVIFFCGNGASATMAEHMSHDCFQNADLPTYTVSETSHLTAISNDISFEHVFAYRIGKMCGQGDMLVTISSSGNSPNIIRAIEAANEKGMFVVTLSGKSPDNKSRRLGDLNFYVPLNTYGLVESAHAVLLHCWLDLYLEKYKGGRH